MERSIKIPTKIPTEKPVTEKSDAMVHLGISASDVLSDVLDHSKQGETQPPQMSLIHPPLSAPSSNSTLSSQGQTQGPANSLSRASAVGPNHLSTKGAEGSPEQKTTLVLR